MSSPALRPVGEAPLFPLYQLMDAFEAFTHGEPDVKPQHRSLYYFLLAYARKRGNMPRFPLPFDVGMHGSSIGSWVTYDAALKALHKWGFIGYTPGANRYKVPVVELTFRGSEHDELLGYWQAYCLAHPVELQNCNPSPPLGLQNCNPTPAVELQNCNPSQEVELHFLTSTDKPSANSTGDIKKTFRPKTNDLSADAGCASDLDLVGQPAPAAHPSPGKGKRDKGGGPPPAPAADPGPSFAAFWEAYGKKVGKHKSEKRWRSLSPADRVAALAAVPAYVTRTPTLQFRQHPLTWLNGRHWEDEPPAEQAAAAVDLPPPATAPTPTPNASPPPVALALALNPEVAAANQRADDAAFLAHLARHAAPLPTEPEPSYALAS